MYDYTFITEMENGQVRKTTYQKLIRDLQIADEFDSRGVKFSEGITPQAQFVADLIKTELEGVRKVTVEFNGEPIFSTERI